MHFREMWGMSRHFWSWAASVSLLPIYMTMTQSDSIVSSLWTFNSPVSQLYLTIKPSIMQKPAKASDRSKPQSNVSWNMAAARIFSGLKIQLGGPTKMFCLNVRAVWPRRCWPTIKCNGWHGESNALNLWLYLDDSCALRGSRHPHRHTHTTWFHFLRLLTRLVCVSTPWFWLAVVADGTFTLYVHILVNVLDFCWVENKSLPFRFGLATMF